MKLIYILFISLLIIYGCKDRSHVVHQDEIIYGEIGQRLDSLITPYIKKLRLLTDNEAGLAIGVTKGNRIVYLKTFGYADIEKKEQVNLNTKFHIASLSKPFVAFATLKLVEEGKIELDDHIDKYLPELNDADNRFGEVTIRQILTHSSGIPRHISVEDWQNPVVDKNALERNLTQLLDFELDFEPGSKYSYSNAGFDILGLIISRASGTSFFDFVQQEVLLPSGMTQSTYIKPIDSLPSNWANSHSYGLKTQVLVPYPYNLKVAPSAGLKSTILDMCNWGMLHLGKGSINGQEVLDMQLFETMVSPQFKTPWDEKIGLSWYLQKYLDRPIILHTGDSHGFESMIYIYPEEDISIVILANRSYSRTGRMVNAVSEVLFEEQPKSYQVSGIYKYAVAYLDHGPNVANDLWEQMKKDTTDNYFIDDNDILASADILDNGKKWQESKDLLEYYLKENPNSTFAWRLYGNANLNLGDTTKAISSYEKTLEINPNYEKGRIALEQLLKDNN